MNEQSIQKLKSQFGNRIQENVPFSSLTTVEIGGPARVFIEAKSIKELKEILNFVKQKEIPFFIMGGGSNLLVSDEGVNKLVIKVSNSGVKTQDNLVIAQAGTPLQKLIDFTIEHGLGGLNRMTGIPGTVGGAIYGNAGSYGQMVGDNIQEILGFDPEAGEEVLVSKGECQFTYRSSGFKKNGLIILEAIFKLPNEDPETLAKEADECLNLRNVKYKPGTKCPGSFFRNLFTSEVPESALKLLPERADTYGKTPSYVFIEELGGKGDQIGNVKIADFHANLFLNLGEGTATDFWNLASKWYKKVEEHFGVRLEPEVQLVNLPPFGEA